MKGLLHRLAARAAGTAWTVRSDVRLPFGAAGLEQAQEDAPAPQMVNAAVPERRAPMQARSEAAVPAAAAMPHAVPPAAQAVAAAPRAAHTQPTRTAQAMAATPRPLMPERQQAAAARTPTAATTQPSEFAPAASTAPSAPAAAIAATAPSPSLVGPQSPPVFQGEAPAPLLPPRPRAAGHAAPPAQGAQGAMPFARRATPQAEASRETEVHIHIGRVDVTALHEAPRPKARPRERTQPVSLDAYLAARSKS